MGILLVEGHGLNAEELARNPRRLNHYFVSLNENLNMRSKGDAVLNAVSVQYLQCQAVFAEFTAFSSQVE